MTKQTIVVLSILDDDPDREWWRALGLPDPATWSFSDTFEADVFPKVRLEEEVRRP